MKINSWPGVILGAALILAAAVGWAMVWIERVGTKDPGAVILEDGEVAPQADHAE